MRREKEHTERTLLSVKLTPEQLCGMEEAVRGGLMSYVNAMLVWCDL